MDHHLTFIYMTVFALYRVFDLTLGDVERTEPDTFDQILIKMKNVTAENCWSRSNDELELPLGSVAQVPIYDDSSNSVTYGNSSVLLHLHNTALYRALYYSFVYQKMNRSNDWLYQPNLMHLYMSSTADVSANRGWNNGSALWFDKKCTYPNWTPITVHFNQTLELFGIRAWNGDNTFDTNWIREPINETADGHVFVDNRDKKYTDPEFKFCPYTPYRYVPWSLKEPLFWWPDDTGYLDSRRKYVYTVGVKFSNATGMFTSDAFEETLFFGPPLPYVSGEDQSDRDLLPVKMTNPYFDCGRSNRWIVSMTSPVTEYMPRYLDWVHLRRPRFVAVIGMDIDYEQLDINPCPFSEENPYPNLFANTARCRNTTVCEPLSGFGLRRGGYQCSCKTGLYYPWEHDGPFQGVDLEQATEEQYNSGSFDCVAVEELVRFNAKTSAFLGRGEAFEIFENVAWLRAQSIIAIDQSSEITGANCLEKASSQLHMAKDIIYRAAEQFEAQGRTALRIAHFLSNFLQNVNVLHGILSMNGEFADYSHYTRRVQNEIQIFGDVIAAVMSDNKLASVGVFFDRNKFYTDQDRTKELFGPFAYRTSINGVEPEVEAVDHAGFSTPYADQEWFGKIKENWTANIEGLQYFSDRPEYLTGTKITYRGPVYEDGEWSEPTFKCDGMVTAWALTYKVPFFGPPDGSETGLEFKGVVSVDVKLSHLDINQCPADSHVNNAFRNTAKCHYETQYCVPLPGRGFKIGSYRCVCRHGYEYPFPNISWLDGETMEEEYENKMNGKSNRYDALQCKEIVVVSPSTVGVTMPDNTSSALSPSTVGVTTPGDTSSALSPSTVGVTTPDNTSSTLSPSTVGVTTPRETSSALSVLASFNSVAILAVLLLCL